MDASSPPAPDLLAHAGFVRRLARSLVADAAEADDVAQDALVAAMASRGTPRHLGSWLTGTVRNLARMSARGAGRRRRREAAVAARSAVSADPADVAAQVEVQRRVVEAVVALEEPYRSTVVYRYYHDLGPEEIAHLTRVPMETVRTRLRRAHEALRERLDSRFGARRAWLVPLLPLAGATGSTVPSALATGGIAVMKARSALAFVLLPLLGAAVAVPVWTAIRPSPEPPESRDAAALREDVARLAAENRTLRERLDGLARPGLEGAGATAPPPGAPPAVVPSTAAPPAPAPAPGGASATPSAVDWARWIPVLERYLALGDDGFPDDALRRDLEAMLPALGERVPGRRWETAEDLFRAPEIGGDLAVALAERFGAAWSPEQKRDLLAELRDILADLDRASGALLPEERMAKTLEAVRRMVERVGASSRSSVSAQVARFLFDVLRDRGWGTIHLGVVTRELFRDTVLQMAALLAQLEPAERRDVEGSADRWWQDAVRLGHDLVRRHGRATVLAAIADPKEDTPESVKARKDESFDAVRIAVWADLAALQARAAREYRTVWERLPSERRRSMDALQPSLLLYLPEE